MSELRSALDEMRADELRRLGDEELSERLDEIERAVRVLESERARTLAEVERRGTYATDGRLSLTSWVAERHGTTHGVAAAQVRMARALEHMPRTARALAEGEVSTPAVGLLVSACQSCPDEYVRAEQVLVDAARGLRVSDLRTVIERWQQAVDQEHAAEAEQRRFERRRLHVSPTLSGMVRVDGDLDPETGQVVLTALRSVMDVEARAGEPDGRTPPQRRADALGVLCRAWLDRVDRPRVGGERPHVVVTMDLDALQARAGGRATLGELGPITPEAARRLACDAEVTRVITDAQSMPLDVGRATKVVSPALRRALEVRDGGCAFPSCDRPPAWCDAHHVRHWGDWGRTCLENLVLLCRRHHRVVHHGRFRVQMEDGRPVFRRGDGTVLEDRGRAPPVAVPA